MVLQVAFTREEREKIRKKYHFEEKDRERLNWMVNLLESFVRAKVWYRICQAGEIESISYSRYMVAVVTLSEYSDRLIALESEAGNLLDAYMLDCIALEFLSAAYRQAAERIYQETRLWQGDFQFFGEQLSLEQLPSVLELVLQKFPDMPVRLNAFGMLVPMKSVVYLAELTEEQKRDECDICFGCRNLECVYRKELE